MLAFGRRSFGETHGAWRFAWVCSARRPEKFPEKQDTGRYGGLHKQRRTEEPSRVCGVARAQELTYLPMTQRSAGGPFLFRHTRKRAQVKLHNVAPP